MRRLNWVVALLLLLTLPAQAFALDMDFYTYDGFSETVNAFKRVSLVFANNEYTTLFFVAVVFGLLFGGMFTYARGIMNFQNSASGLSLAWLMTTLIGVLIFKALITPKGTIHVYDPVRNAYEAVADVPDLIVLLAGVTNKAERAVQRIVDASAAHPYENEAGGVSFELLLNATTDRTFSSNYYLQKSIRQYFKDCSKLALVLPSYNVDLEDIKSGTDDLLTTLAEMRSASMFTTYYSSGANKGGTVLSCNDAYDNFLAPQLNATATYDEFLDTVCVKSGFDIANLPQKTACETKIQTMNANVFGAPGAPSAQLLRNVVISNAMSQVMLDENPDAGIRALTNRSMMTNGLGIAVAANEWMPKIRASVTAIVLGLIPVLVLFIVTPMFPTALKLIIALLGWITIWGVLDVIISQIAMDQAYDAIREIQRHQMGLSAMFLAPESATQALSLFGKARGMGIGISAFIAAMLFKMSPYGLTSLAGNWSGQVDQQGSSAADQNQSPVSSAKALDDLASARATSNLIAESGWDNVSNTTEYNRATDVSQATMEMDGLSGMGYGGGPASQGAIKGAQRAGQTLGGVEARNTVSGATNGPEEMKNLDAGVSNIETQNRFGQADGQADAASGSGYGSVYSLAAQNTALQLMRSTADNATVGSMVERIQDAHPGLDRGDAWKVFANASNADLMGKLQATGWHADEVVQMAEFMATATQQQQTGMLSYMEANKLTPADVFQARGTASAASDHGTAMALQNIPPEQLAIAQSIQAIRNGADANAVISASAQRGGGVVDYIQNVATMAQSGTAADLSKFELFADASGMDLAGAVLRNRLAEAGSFSMTKDEMVRAHEDHGWFTDKQLDSVADSSRVTFALNGNGDIVYSSTLSGNSTAINNGTNIDNSYTETDTTRVETGGKQAYPNAALWALSDDSGDQIRLAEALQSVQGGSQAGNRVALIQQLTAPINAIGGNTFDRADAAGWEGKAGLQSPIPGINAGIAATTSGGYQSNERMDMNRQAVKQILNDAFAMAESADRPTNPSSLTPDQDRWVQAASYFQTQYQQLIHDNEARAEDDFTKSDHDGKDLKYEEPKPQTFRSRSNAGRTPG